MADAVNSAQAAESADSSDCARSAGFGASGPLWPCHRLRPSDCNRRVAHPVPPARRGCWSWRVIPATRVADLDVVDPHLFHPGAIGECFIVTSRRLDPLWLSRAGLCTLIVGAPPNRQAGTTTGRAPRKFRSHPSFIDDLCGSYPDFCFDQPIAMGPTRRWSKDLSSVLGSHLCAAV